MIYRKLTSWLISFSWWILLPEDFSLHDWFGGEIQKFEYFVGSRWDSKDLRKLRVLFSVILSLRRLTIRTKIYCRVSHAFEKWTSALNHREIGAFCSLMNLQGYTDASVRKSRRERTETFASRHGVYFVRECWHRSQRESRVIYIAIPVITERWRSEKIFKKSYNTRDSDSRENNYVIHLLLQL